MASAVLRSSISAHPLRRPSRFCSRSAPTPRRLPPSTVLAVRSEVSFSSSAHLIPHPSKVERGGEDALFMSSYNGGVLGVADGVSGWAARNVDPAYFSQELMSHASRLVDDEEVNYDPQILLGKAHAATSSIGSATVIIAMLDKNGTLKIANVGDCGLRVIRRGQVIFCTSPQEHYFDCPYQLSSEMPTQTSLDATVCSVQLMVGDTVVMGSDGLFDNIFDHEILSVISASDNVTNAAKALADLAKEHSGDRNFDSPYSLEARTRGFDVPIWKKVLGMKLTGGSMDLVAVTLVDWEFNDEPLRQVCHRYSGKFYSIITCAVFLLAYARRTGKKSSRTRASRPSSDESPSHSHRDTNLLELGKQELTSHMGPKLEAALPAGAVLPWPAVGLNGLLTLN